MQTVTCLNALKSDHDKNSACNPTKVHGERQYFYSPASSISALDCISSPPSQPAFSESGSSNAAPGPGSLHKWEPVSRSADFLPTEADSSLLVKALCRLRSDIDAPYGTSQSTEVSKNSCILKTLHQLTFNSCYLDPYTYQGYETVGCRYLYAPPFKISGFVDEGFPLPYTHVHPDGWQAEVNTLESEELVETSSCTAVAADTLLTEADELPVFNWSIIEEENFTPSTLFTKEIHCFE